MDDLEGKGGGVSRGTGDKREEREGKRSQKKGKGVIEGAGGKRWGWGGKGGLEVKEREQLGNERDEQVGRSEIKREMIGANEV